MDEIAMQYNSVINCRVSIYTHRFVSQRRGYSGTMRNESIIFILAVLVMSGCAALERCEEEPVHVECDSNTEYHSYVECMRRRTKRHVECEPECSGGDCSQSECGECDCNYCSQNECSNTCTSCCGRATTPCTTRLCCQQTCHSQCRTTTCRRNCRQRCQTRLPQQSSSSNTNTSATSDSKHNITTIINLHNVINNTNIIDMPINLNNTNVNNITVEAPEGAAQSQVHVIERERVQQQQSCCKIIGPRQCVPTNAYPFSKCFHYRKQHCGDLCKTSIVHAEPHEVCDQVGSSCHKQVIYIPQPKPRCTYTSQWPFVKCSIHNPNCGGCYSHVVKGGTPPPHCPSSCYDEGYDVGPLYRQGPYFQPSYMPVPPCTYTGTCGNNPYQYYPYGQQQFQNLSPYETSYQIQPLPSPEGQTANITDADEATLLNNEVGQLPLHNMENFFISPRNKKEVNDESVEKES